MPLPQYRGAVEFESFLAPAEDFTSADVDVVEIPLIHELGSDLRAGTLEKTRVIKPSNRPVVVKVQSQVVTEAIQRLHSPQYLAAVRRRKCRQLSDALGELAKDAGEDFVVCTYPVVKKINELLDVLTSGAGEGNTREVLRQVRNTLMNGGWNKYRAAAARQVAIHVVNTLAAAEEVIPQQVDSAFEQLHYAGLNPVGPPLVDIGGEDDTCDGQDEILG